jgi:hypothetical protein
LTVESQNEQSDKQTGAFPVSGYSEEKDSMKFSGLRMWGWGFLAASLLPSSPAQTTVTNTVTHGVYEVRDFFAQNGRHISITSHGNLINLETPFGFEHIKSSTRAREGYVISYTNPSTGQERVIFDVHDVYSSVLARRDFVPVSFSGPATGTVFHVNSPVSATAIVDTADGLLRLTQRIDWLAGLGGVTIRSTVANRVSVPVRVNFVKRHVDLNPDGGGSYGTNQYSNWERVSGGVDVYAWCNCGPPPGPPPLTPAMVSLHVIKFTGDPAPSYTMIHTAADTSEFYTVGPSFTTDLRGPRTSENNQVTLVWPGSTLGPSVSQTYIARYQAE